MHAVGLPRTRPAIEVLTPAIAGLTALVVYIRTLLPGMAFGDWGEMQTVPHVLGIPHPTGYPTYVLAAWVAQLVPIGSVAFRANVFSAVLTASAIAIVVAILLQLGVRPLIALAAGLGLGAVRTVWAAATVAEVNPMHLLFVALLLHRALVWETRRRVRDLLLVALLLGLALGNHLLIVFVAPFVALFVLWVGRREIRARPIVTLAAIAAGIAGLAPYLYVPLAASQSPPLPYNHPVTLDAVLWLVTGSQFRGQFAFLSPAGLAAFPGSLPGLYGLIADRATPVGVILGLLGLMVLVRRRAAFGLACGGILVVHAYVWANYLRLEHYLLVPFLMLAIGSALLLETVARALDASPRRLPRFGLGVVVGPTALALAAALAITTWPMADRSRDRTADAYADSVFGALPPNAAILSVWDASTPLWHAHFVRGRRPDILIVDDTNIVYEGYGTRERRIAELLCERPVFILRLKDTDLQPTRAAFRLAPFLAVRIGSGGPSASASREVFRVEPLESAACRP